MRANFSCKLLLVFFLFPFSDECTSLSLHMPVGFLCAGLAEVSVLQALSDQAETCANLLVKRWKGTSQSFQLFTKIGITGGSIGGASTHRGEIFCWLS